MKFLLLFVLANIYLSHNQVFAETKTVPVFTITLKSYKPDPMQYLAQVGTDCTFDKKKPIIEKWIDPAGNQKSLNIIEEYVMGVVVESRNPQIIKANVRTMKNNNIYWPLIFNLVQDESGQCHAFALASDNQQSIELIQVKRVRGRTPIDIVVVGQLNGQRVERALNF